ncbi:DUF6183 family protein [Streptomyces sp. A1499]|uniref:DUF6183 family protein n=1 Tax=Streptomyces sp. A1499 TaxID=2563104 RepID=UPI00109E6D98|nr:DUF6183 family protein [Streptomyces sp. A1499]THC55050.1 hypothetical protein E7X58_01625 [Streptomyces sp. A1499]
MEDAPDDPGHLTRSRAEQRAAHGDTAYLRDLASRLADQYESAAELMREHERRLAHVVRMLALTPGRDSLAQLLRLLAEKRPPGNGCMPRFIASLLAEHHEATDLAAVVFDRPRSDGLDELRACLFHELVLRGVDIASFPQLRSWPVMRPGRHALAWLPDQRRDFEAGARFPSRSVHGSASGMPGGLSAEGRVDPPVPRTSPRSSLRDLATTHVHESITAAAQAGDWGDCGAWVFEPDEALAPERVPALLPALPMSCLDGLGPTDRFEIAVRPLGDVWRLLFATASMGGFGGSGVHAAYGRLWTWRSLAGLSGAPAGASAEEVERRARQSTWFHFQADTEWFHDDVGSSYGLAALSPDRRRLAVLAATDTD